MHRRRQRRKKLLLMLGAVFFALAIVEVVLRIEGYSYPEFYAVDERRGYALRPGMEGWYRKEGEAYIRINRDGLRDREHEKVKPANTLRLAVLGDSYTEALQVPFENSFCAVLEQKLTDCPALAGRRAEVINFGVSGYGTVQELISLRDRVWQYSPDVVLLAMTTNNDITDNVRALKKTDQIPYFIWQDGKLTEDDSFRQTSSFKLRNSALGSIGRWVRDHFRVIQGVDQAYLALKIRLAARKARSTRQVEKRNYSALDVPGIMNSRSDRRELSQPEAQDFQTLANELGIDNLIYREPEDANWQNAWSVTEELIRMVRNEVAGKGATLFVLTLSNPQQDTPDSAGREAFLRHIGAKDIFYPDNRIREFCQREGIGVANLAPAMQKYAAAQNAFLHGFGSNLGGGHWNLAGHRLAGELASEQVCRLLQGPGSDQ